MGLKTIRPAHQFRAARPAHPKIAA